MMLDFSMTKTNFLTLISRMKKIQTSFFDIHGVNDIWSNSKIYEIVIANSLNHNLIPGHSGSRDASDQDNNAYEYKHYKELSSNHSWTFNDYSDNTINNLIDSNYTLIFAHVDDKTFPPRFDWYYEISGSEIGDYLKVETKKLSNNRKMINVSPNQIESKLGYQKQQAKKINNGKYEDYLKEIFDITFQLEQLTGVKNSLTSNKFWEIFVGNHLEHQVNSEQGGRRGSHDAYNDKGESFEYKVSKNYSWNFQDVSEQVLEKYYDDKAIILAIVDKENFKIKHLYSATPENTVPVIKKKLEDKIHRYSTQKKTIRRLQISLSKGDLQKISAEKIY